MGVPVTWMAPSTMFLRNENVRNDLDCQAPFCIISCQRAVSAS